MSERDQQPRDPSSTQKMHPELKAKWIEALRSGRYKQGRGGLRDGDNCYCCLGVLADLVDPHGWSTHAEHQFSHDRDFYSHRGEPEMLPSVTLSALGLDVGDVACILASKNDGDDHKEIEPHNFEQIADWIETNL